MAAVEAQTILPKILRSPATTQYHIPRSRPKNWYISRFSFTKEKFQESIKQDYLDETDPMMPSYPYGKNVRFPEANLGLYGGATVQTGHKISKGRNKGKTLRQWFPNVKVETLRSEFLQKSFTIPVTARVKRTIEKCGGLDQYLLGSTTQRIKELGLLGWKLRWHVMRSPTYQATVTGQDKQLAESLTQEFSQVWSDPQQREQLIAAQMEKWKALKMKDDKFREHFRSVLMSDHATKTNVSAVPTLKLMSPELLELPDTIAEEGSKTMYRRPPVPLTPEQLKKAERIKMVEEARQAKAKKLQERERLSSIVAPLESSIVSTSDETPLTGEETSSTTLATGSITAETDGQSKPVTGQGSSL